MCRYASTCLASICVSVCVYEGEDFYVICVSGRWLQNIFSELLAASSQAASPEGCICVRVSQRHKNAARQLISAVGRESMFPS